jgi:hypothetical protein
MPEISTLLLTLSSKKTVARPKLLFHMHHCKIFGCLNQELTAIFYIRREQSEQQPVVRSLAVK